MAEEATHNDSAIAQTTIFLDLAAELRNNIYEFTLIKDKPIYLTSTPSYIKEPALLATNRQIRNEALSIFYGSNFFIIRYIPQLHRFIDYSNPKTRRLIRILGLEGIFNSSDLDRNISRFTTLVKKYEDMFHNAETLRMNVTVSSRGENSSYWLSLETLEDVMQRSPSSRIMWKAEATSAESKSAADDDSVS